MNHHHNDYLLYCSAVIFTPRARACTAAHVLQSIIGFRTTAFGMNQSRAAIHHQSLADTVVTANNLAPT